MDEPSQDIAMKRLSSLKFLCSLISMLILPSSSFAVDFITSKKSLRDNETLVSSNEVFELGFFCLSYTNNRYLGLWYKKAPTQRVWVANRDNPIIDSIGVLTITYNGKLALLNQSLSTIWSPNISTSPRSKNPVLQLLNSGNLVLRENTTASTYLWQSFDHPCDTLLPGMKISWNAKTSQERYLTSWKAPDDPSSGDSTYKIDEKILPQLVLTVGSAKKFRSGPWDGVRFTGVSPMTNRVMTPLMRLEGHEWSYAFKQNDDEVFATVLMVSQSGSVQRLVLNDTWSVLYSVPNEPCNVYGTCGANSICRTSKSTLCECLRGFVPKSSDEWNVSIWDSGCVRRTSLRCDSGDRFQRLVGARFPDLLKYRVDKKMSLEECEAQCSRDCSCTAYANSDIKNRGSGCVMWFGDLVDMREFNNQDDNELDIYIRLAASEFESKHSSKKRKAQLAMSMFAVTLFSSVLGLSIWCIIRKREAKRRGLTSKKEDIDLPLFDLATIATATENFSDTNVLGEGGYGPVYKGRLSSGQEIAVKRLSKDSGQGVGEFKNEVLLIAKLQHRNLVALLGCCIQREERTLVYEYMPNKSLDHFIFGRNKSVTLDWETRFRIITGIARGLLYLHQDSKLQIIHRDLKASNILLDSDMNPKISDFGLARIFGGDEIETKTKRVIGTYGYMSPEYALDGNFSVKSDVFSFGVVLLETISGTRNRGFSHPDHHHNLLGHAWMLWNEDEALELVDSISLSDSYAKSQVLRCVQISLLCVQKFPVDRPTMASVVLMLANEEMKLPRPKEPAFFVERSSIVDDQMSTKKEFSCARFETTVTLFEGR